MSTHLFNRDANGDASQIPLGGLPYYNDDIMDLQNNIVENFGVASILKGYSCVLGGCLVDEVNTTAKTVKVTAGTVLLNGTNGPVAVDFPGYEGPYPFAIQLVETDIDSRAFKVGTTFDVGKRFSTTIRTSFSFGAAGSTLESIMPTDLSANEIYFDPFTGQKAEHILGNLRSGFNEIRPNYRNTIVTQTESGRSIVGPSLNSAIGNDGRWKWLGWKTFSTTSEFTFRNAGTEGSNAGTISGQNEFKIDKNQLPKHQHSEASGFGGTLLTYDGPNNGFNGSHQHSLVNDQGNIDTAAEFGTEEVKSGNGALINGSEFRSIVGTDFSGKHVHGIQGKTGRNDETWGASQDNLDTRSRSLYCTMWHWKGYQVIDNFYSFYSGEISGMPNTNM